MSTTSVLSFAEFEQLADRPEKLELLDGELIVSPPANRHHHRVGTSCETYLWRYWPRGQVSFELAFKIHDHCLVPDVSVLYADQPMDEEYWLGAPAIAIEVRSPSNTLAELERKIEVYLLNDIRPATEVWVVEEKRRSVTVYRAQGGAITLVRHTEPFTCTYGNAVIDPSTFFAR
jgi:Uma2 family endonuclease